jgi:hypothetical protein
VRQLQRRGHWHRVPRSRGGRALRWCALIAEPRVLAADGPTARQEVITAAALTDLFRQRYLNSE